MAEALRCMVVETKNSVDRKRISSHLYSHMYMFIYIHIYVITKTKLVFIYPSAPQYEFELEFVWCRVIKPLRLKRTGASWSPRLVVQKFKFSR